MTPLAPRSLRASLSALPGWRIEDGKLTRNYIFPDFTQAFAFMSAAALVIEKLGHHPEWSNTYNRVDVRLVTHDAGGITRKDFDLASRLEALARKML